MPSWTRREDELLGVAPPDTAAAKPFKDAALGYDGGALPSGELNDDDDDEGMDMQMMMAQMMSMSSSVGVSGGVGGSSGGLAGPGSMYGSAYALKRDKLNLSGLLNVLDGVVDTPERIVVMTTNHPEILDPALIRPGRIDQKLLLGYMQWHNVVDMINHYFQLKEGGGEGLNEALAARVRDAVLGNDAKGMPGLELTPAQVEQLSAENDTVEEMIEALERKAPGVTNEIHGTSSDEQGVPKPARPMRQSSKTKVVFE